MFPVPVFLRSIFLFLLIEKNLDHFQCAFLRVGSMRVNIAYCEEMWRLQLLNCTNPTGHTAHPGRTNADFLWKSGQIQDKMRFGGLGIIFTVNIFNRIAQKLRIIILLHFGLIFVWIDFGKTRQVIVFMVSDLADATMTPKTNDS